MQARDFTALKAHIDQDPALIEQFFRITDPQSLIAAVLRYAKEHDFAVVEGELWTAHATGNGAWLRSCTP